MTSEADLDLEESRRRRCVSHLRGSDMGEAVTNRLMEQLSDNPALLDEGVSEDSPSARRPFEVREMSKRDNTLMIETRIASIEISAIMAVRLRCLYVTQHPVQLLTPRYLSDFSRAAFMLLYRYSYVDPGFRRQSYLAPRYFESISRAFGRDLDLEAFAAAFNATVPSYCSLFPDVESPFGSRGSFFDLQQLRSDDVLIQVSPPRIGSLTNQAILHAAQLLRQSDDAEEHYFLTLTPRAWGDTNELIKESGFLVWQNHAAKGDMIEYYDVIQNRGSWFPMPHVSVLSNRRSSPLPERTSRILHSVFSSGSSSK